jgi:hypothetical protein
MKAAGVCVNPQACMCKIDSRDKANTKCCSKIEFYVSNSASPQPLLTNSILSFPLCVFYFRFQFRLSMSLEHCAATYVDMRLTDFV